MTVEEIQAICQAFKGVTQDIKWQDHLCFNVGDKMFIVTSPDSVPVSASFKTSDEEFDELSAREGFQPAPYMARHKWVFMDDISRLSYKQWEHYARLAYELVAAKLPAKTRKQLSL